MNRVLILFSVSTLLSCEYYDDRLIIKNQMKENIVIEYYSDSFPDSTMTNKTAFYLSRLIQSGEEKREGRLGNKNEWPLYINNSLNNSLNLFVFKEDTLKKYKEINTLIKNNLFIYYQFSKKELEDREWVVIIK